MSFSFVHAADIHLDSPLRGLDRYDGAPVKELRSATRRAFENLVDYCVETSPAFLLLAGDLYDGDWKDYNTGLFFLRQMARLGEAGVHVFIVRGNHDAESVVTKSLRWPERLFHVFSAKEPRSVPLESHNVVVHGQSFSHRDVVEDLAANYPKRVPGAFNIGLLHTCADGASTDHSRYAPCSLNTLREKGYDYWALGHIHQRQELSREPYIVFPGNLQGRHIRETGKKGATVVTVDDCRIQSVRQQSFDVARWVSCELSVVDDRTPEDVVDRVRGEIQKHRSQSDQRPLAIRVRLVGASDAHQGLQAQPGKWTSEIRAAAVEFGDVWIEKVLIETSTSFDVSELRKRRDPIGELLRTIDEVRADANVRDGLLKEIRHLQDKLPHELFEGPGALQLRDEDIHSEWLRDVEQILLQRLLVNGEAT